MIANFTLYAVKAVLILIASALISYGAVFYHAPEKHGQSSANSTATVQVPMKRYHIRNSWHKHTGPVMSASLPWEEHCVSEPSIWKSNHQWHMIYTGGWYHGNHLGYATSKDGIHWSKHSTPIVEHGSESSFYRENGTLYVYYSPTINTNAVNGGNLLVASGPDALHLKVHQSPAMLANKNANGIVNTCVVKQKGRYVLLFESNVSEVAHWQMGIAYSISPLGPFTIETFPLKALQRTEKGTFGGPDVSLTKGLYTLWYHSSPSGTIPTDIYAATSHDLIHWEQKPMQITRELPYEYDQVADPFVISSGHYQRLYYSAMNNTKGIGMICMASRAIPL